MKFVPRFIALAALLLAACVTEPEAEQPDPHRHPYRLAISKAVAAPMTPAPMMIASAVLVAVRVMVLLPLSALCCKGEANSSRCQGGGRCDPCLSGHVPRTGAASPVKVSCIEVGISGSGSTASGSVAQAASSSAAKAINRGTNFRTA